MPKRLLYAAALLLLAGCGDKASSSGTAPVTGLVTYQGKPVAEANVVFQSPERGSFAITDADGCFELQTFETGDGALPGDYQVMISKLQIIAPEFDMGHPKYVPPPPPKHLIPSKYADAKTSGLTAKVEAGKANDFTFELTD